MKTSGYCSLFPCVRVKTRLIKAKQANASALTLQLEPTSPDDLPEVKFLKTALRYLHTSGSTFVVSHIFNSCLYCSH